MRALWQKDRPWMLAMFVIGAIAMAVAVADQGFVDVFVLAPHRLEACFYVAGAAGLLLGAVAVLWDRLLGTREFLTQRPIGKRALAWSPLLACMVVLLAWQLMVPVLSWGLASIYAGMFEPTFWVGVPQILATTAIAWPACAIGCLASSLPAPWWLRLLLAVTLTLSVGVAIDFGHARDSEGFASLLGYGLACLLPAAGLFAIAASLGSQRHDADQPWSLRTRWLGGLLLLLSVSPTATALCKKAQQHAIHQVIWSYPSIAEVDGQVRLASGLYDRDGMRVCDADHLPVAAQRPRSDFALLEYDSSGSWCRFEIEAPRFHRPGGRRIRLDYSASVLLRTDGSAWLHLAQEGLLSRTGLGPQCEPLPSEVVAFAIEDVGEAPNQQALLCGDVSTGKLWRFDRTLRYFVDMPLPDADRFAGFGRLRRTDAPVALPAQSVLLALFFEREEPLQFVRGATATYAMKDGEWLLLDAGENTVNGSQQLMDARESPANSPKQPLAVRSGDDPFNYTVTVPAHGGFASFQHDFQPRTSMERLCAGYSMFWSLIYPPVLQVVSSVSLADSLSYGGLLDPLVASGRRVWLLVGCWLVALASVALLRRRLLRIGVAAPARWFWLVLGTLTGPVGVVVALLIETRRRHARPQLLASPQPRIVTEVSPQEVSA